eukprot:s2261_g7.t1
MEKHSQEESQKREDQKGESQKREDAGARKGSGELSELALHLAAKALREKNEGRLILCEAQGVQASRENRVCTSGQTDSNAIRQCPLFQTGLIKHFTPFIQVCI